MVKDIRPGGGYYDGSSPGELTPCDGLLYFKANNGVDGDELWKSDGTEQGTVMVKDIRPGGGYYDGSYPDELTPCDGHFFFEANNGSDGRELWKSDGTEQGTVMVRDIRPGSDSSYPHELTAVNGTLYFVADNGLYGDELWKSDGTEQGTVMVRDIFPGVSGSGPSELTMVDGVLYFIADNGLDGAELWKSDGTEQGTVMVRDIFPGGPSSLPYGLTAYGGLLFLNATNGIDGWELWKSDGTEQGTVMIVDIRPGSDGGIPNELTPLGGALFFTADNGTYGTELWSVYTDVIYVDAAAPAGGDGSSWNRAFWGINEAIAAAPPDAAVWVAQGVYHETIQPGSGLTLLGGFTGTEIYADQRNSINNPTVIDGGLADRAVILDRVSGVVLDGFVIRGGSAEGGGAEDSGGGLLGVGLDNTVVVARCRFEDNTAAAFGGAMFLTDASPLVLGCLFSGNRAENGGAIALRGTSSPRIVSCGFYRNQADGHGGGVYADSGFSLSYATLFENDAGGEAGALYETGGEVSIDASIIWGNTQGAGYQVAGYPVYRASDLEDSGGSGGGWNEAMGVDGGGNLDMDPLFGHDYHLRHDSPCVNAVPAGLSGPPEDIDGEARPQAELFDMGADEFKSTDGDRIPDYWERKWFGTIDQNDTSDYNGNGVLDLDEFANGTNPT